MCLGVTLTQRHGGLPTAAELLVPPGQCPAEPESPAYRHVGRLPVRTCAREALRVPWRAGQQESAEVREGRWKGSGGQAEASSERGTKRGGNQRD